MIKKWIIKATADAERRLPERRAIIYVEDYEQAMELAWKMFPEYKEVGVYLQD